MKTKLFNFFRSVFKIPVFEKALRRCVQGKLPTHFLAKLVPNNYQYPKGSVRTFDYEGIHLQLDIYDYVSHWLYFGFRDDSHKTLMSLVKPGQTILDIGTNYGTTILQFAKLLNGQGFAYGFEPDPLNFKLCQQNMSLNPFTNIEVENIGLGNTESSLYLVVDTASNRGGNRISTQIDNREHTEVKVIKLDSWAITKNLSQVDLLKIDVEGYEYEVLKGGVELLKRFKPTLFIELDDENLRLQQSSALELVEFLQALGYQLSHSETKQIVDRNTNFSNCHFDVLCQCL